ncbi:hypothetical protein ACXZ9C_11605 [Streptococcus agalactiae]
MALAWRRRRGVVSRWRCSSSWRGVRASRWWRSTCIASHSGYVACRSVVGAWRGGECVWSLVSIVLRVSSE